MFLVVEGKQTVYVCRDHSTGENSTQRRWTEPQSSPNGLTAVKFQRALVLPASLSWWAQWTQSAEPGSVPLSFSSLRPTVWSISVVNDHSSAWVQLFSCWLHLLERCWEVSLHTFILTLSWLYLKTNGEKGRKAHQAGLWASPRSLLWLYFFFFCTSS